MTTPTNPDAPEAKPDDYRMPSELREVPTYTTDTSGGEIKPLPGCTFATAAGTDTPETDAQIEAPNCCYDGMWVDFARRLERDRNALRGQVERHEKTMRGFYSDMETALGEHRSNHTVAHDIRTLVEQLAAANAALEEAKIEQSEAEKWNQTSIDECNVLRAQLDAANAQLEQLKRENQERREQSAAAVRSYLDEVANSAALKAQLDAARAEGGGFEESVERT